MDSKVEVHVENKNRKAIRRLRILDGDIIMLKQDSGLGTAEVVNRLAGILQSRGLHRCLVVVANDLGDIQRLDRDDMEDLGWVRK